MRRKGCGARKEHRTAVEHAGVEARRRAQRVTVLGQTYRPLGRTPIVPMRSPRASSSSCYQIAMAAGFCAAHQAEALAGHVGIAR
jgi:hypothetical protein